MPGINFLAVVVAAALAFVASAVWYIVFGKQLATVSAAFAQGLQKRQPWKLLGVMAQSLVLAYLLGLVGKVDWLGALGVGVLLWIGLAAMQDELATRGVQFERYEEGPQTDQKGILRGRALHMGPDIAWYQDPAGNTCRLPARVNHHTSSMSGDSWHPRGER